MQEELVNKIDALLPQTQCRQCGYDGCLPYAQAIANGKADINQCPPGGTAGIEKLAELLNIGVKPLNPAHCTEQPRRVAIIIEQDCIGCCKCLPPCPLDAIIGANKHMHTIVTAECSGCELCIPACPVDCITLYESDDLPAWNAEAANQARRRHQNKQARLEQQQKELQARLEKQKSLLLKLKAKKSA